MTEPRKRVTAYAKSTVVSVAPVRPGKTYPLSVLDHAMERHSLHMVFYYRSGSKLDRAKLKESMSELLWYFPATTGRMKWEEGGKRWVVKCNDAGVRTVDARAEATVEEWIATATAAEERDLVYWEPMGVDPSIWSTFYVQITEFKDKGFAIGLSCTHMHSDPTCAALLIKAWSDCHRRSAISNPPFFHPPALTPRPNPNPSSPFLSLKSSSSSSSSTTTSAAPRRFSSATFRFSAASVRSLLRPPSTPFSALSALFYLAISRVNSPPPPHSPSQLTLVTDFRKRMHAPLPFGFYGNAAHFSSVQLDPTASLASVSDSIARHVDALQEEDYWSAIDWLAGAGAGGGPFQMYGPEVTCVKLDHVMAYEAEMEKGVGPAHVSCWFGGAEGGGIITVLPAAVAEEEEEGRTVQVVLPAAAAEKVFKDEDILMLGPDVIFAGRI